MVSVVVAAAAFALSNKLASYLDPARQLSHKTDAGLTSALLGGAAKLADNYETIETLWKLSGPLDYDCYYYRYC